MAVQGAASERCQGLGKKWVSVLSCWLGMWGMEMGIL